MKVLIVEDEILERKALIHLMKTEFEQVSIVLTADNGEQAVKMAVQERPDLILMDINLPLLDGISAMKKIREQLEDCPVIMVSAYSDYEHLRGSMREHALDYLVKPYSVETFVEAVKRGLGIDNKREEHSFYGKTGSVLQVKKYLETHFMDNVSLQDVAEKVNLDKSYLGRVFREECGITVMGYLKNIRIEKAKELLLCGMGASEVAMQTGFADPAYFAKIFKQEMGITPSRYREYHHAE